MKSFFKKLSLVLVAAMVITMLPAQSAKADTKIGIGIKADGKASTSLTVEVGEQTGELGFWGVVGYDVAASQTKKWVSQNPAIATVVTTNGKSYLKGVAAGTTTLSFTVTAAGVKYAGSCSVVVTNKAAAQTQGDISIKQTAFDTVEITMPDAETAKANEKKVEINRVKSSARGVYLLSVKATTKADENKIVVSGLADKVTYQIVVLGKTFEITTSIGPVADIVLSYPTVYIGTGNDITGNPIKAPVALPTVKIIDKDQKIVTYDVSKVKYTYDKGQTENASLLSQSTGKIKFTNVNARIHVKASYTYKDAAGVSTTFTDEGDFYPTLYEAPNLQGFVEKICLTDKTGKNVVYPSDYVFTGELAVGQAMDIAYYFLTPEGVKYTGNNVKDTAAVSGESDSSKNILVCNAQDYPFYFILDDESATTISLYRFANHTTVRGWNETVDGPERVCLYKQVGKSQDPKVDTLVGVIDITVSPEPYVYDLGLEDSAISGFKGGLEQTGSLTFEVIDQYGEPYNVLNKITAKGTDGSSVSNIVSVTYETDSDKVGKGKITVDFAALVGTSQTDVDKEIVLSVRGTDYQETLNISGSPINLSGEVGYELIIDNKEIKNVDFTTESKREALGLTFKVAKTLDDVKYVYVPFALSSENVDEDALSIPQGTVSGHTFTGNNAEDYLVLVLTDVDGKILTEDAAGTAILATTSAYGQAQFTSICSTPGDGWFFDLYGSTTATSVVGDYLLTGTLNASVYQLTQSGSTVLYDIATDKEIEISDSMELLQNVDNTYSLTISGTSTKKTSTKTWADKTVVGTVTTDDAYKTLIQTIVGGLYGWFDKNSDGKATAGEVGALSSICPEFRVVDAKFEKGANITGSADSEIFIKNVTVEFSIGGTAKVQQTLTIGRKYTYR